MRSLHSNCSNLEVPGIPNNKTNNCKIKETVVQNFVKSIESDDSTSSQQSCCAYNESSFSLNSIVKSGNRTIPMILFHVLDLKRYLSHVFPEPRRFFQLLVNFRKFNICKFYLKSCLHFRWTKWANRLFSIIFSLFCLIFSSFLSLFTSSFLRFT